MTDAPMQQQEALVVPDTDAIRNELGLLDTQGEGGQGDPQLEQKAAEFVKTVLQWDPSDSSQIGARDASISSVEQLGSGTQQESARRSAMLKQPIRTLAEKSEDGGQVAKSLIELNTQIDQLDPGKYDLNPGWFARTLGRLPGVGTPLQKYFIRFQQADTVIDSVIRSLEDGKDQLKRDNTTLRLDQNAMREMTLRLNKTIHLGQLIDQRLEYALQREVASDDPRRKFIEEELLFPLRQRIVDIQQQLAVNQQGVLAIELILRNNKELIKGVNRAVNVTVNALTIAVTVAMALANQKIVLDKVGAVNKTTNHLLEQTAAQLKQQGVAIQKQAAESQLNIESLARAFTDIRVALDDIGKFRQEALPKMAQNILQMEQLSNAAEEHIRKLEQGNRLAPSIVLDIDAA